MIGSECVYTPSAWGREFHALPHHEALGAGSAGPGKSLVLLMDPLPQIYVESQRQTDPNHPYPIRRGQSLGWAVHLRREAAMLDQTVSRAKRIFPVIDPGARWYQSDLRFVMSSGFMYEFRHCKDPDDWQAYQSNEYSHIGYDELVQFEEEQYIQINTRLRSSDPILRQMLKIRAMSNPEMRRPATATWHIKNPHWVRDYFVKPCPKGRATMVRKVMLRDGTEVERTRIYLPATLWDNPDKDFVRSYEEQLQSAKPHIRQALLWGNWWVTAGSFHADEWNEKVHVVEPYRIPQHWRRFRAMDWGFRKWGTIGWWALDEEDNLVKEREYNFKGMLDEEVAAEVKRIEEKLGLWSGRGSRITGPADTQLWERRGDSSLSKAEVFMRLGVPWVPAHKNVTGSGQSRYGGKQRNAELLSARLKDTGRGTKHPRIVFMRCCTKTIETIPAVQTHPDNKELPMDGGEDHWYDEVLYAVSYASRTARIRPPRPDDDDDDEKDEPKTKPATRYGRYGYWGH